MASHLEKIFGTDLSLFTDSIFANLPTCYNVFTVHMCGIFAAGHLWTQSSETLELSTPSVGVCLISHGVRNSPVCHLFGATFFKVLCCLLGIWSAGLRDSHYHFSGFSWGGQGWGGGGDGRLTAAFVKKSSLGVGGTQASPLL